MTAHDTVAPGGLSPALLARNPHLAPERYAGGAPPVAMRSRDHVKAGTFEHRTVEPISGWHVHDLHEIEYAVSGMAELTTRTAHYLLPPRHAAWVPAGEPHSAVLRRVHTIAVFFEPSAFPDAPRRTTILPVPAVLREMIRYATRWPIDRTTDDDAESLPFFTAMAGVIGRSFDHRAPVSLPVPDDPIVADVMSYTAEHLDDVTADEVCRAIGISPRSLRRRFVTATGHTWRDHLQQARLFRAMALLVEPDRTVLDVATTVGFTSASAFSRAFQQWTGESPSSYRDRCADPATPTAGR